MKNIFAMLLMFVVSAVATGCGSDETQATEDLVSDSAELQSGNAWGILFYDIAIPFELLDAPAVRIDKDRGYGKFHGFKKELGTHEDGKRLLVECRKPDVGPSSCEIFGAGRITLKDRTRNPVDSGERAPLTSRLVGERAARLTHSLPGGNEIKTNDFSLSCEPGGASCTLTGIAIYESDSKF